MVNIPEKSVLTILSHCHLLPFFVAPNFRINLCAQLTRCYLFDVVKFCAFFNLNNFKFNSLIILCTDVLLPSMIFRCNSDTIFL